MTMIADFFRSRKGGDLILAIAAFLLAALSFGLGRLSEQEGRVSPVALLIPTQQRSTTTDDVLGASDQENIKRKADTAPATPPQGGGYVASKSGSVYHLPWCPGAKRIKEENKIRFANKEEAERAGYRPASNCKGI